MAGSFPFPVKYGYAMVGRVTAGESELHNQAVFCLHPHQNVFNIPGEAAYAIPADVPIQRAVLAANMETALNAVWDGAPAPADRIAVIGAGVVGLLTAFLCARLPGAEVTLVDTLASRAQAAHALGARFAPPELAPVGCDVVFHATATAAGLTTALHSAGDEACVVELSWYGSESVAAPLGQEFHSRRLRLISSQVGKVAPSHRPRWSSERRICAALGLLRDASLDALLGPPVYFDDLPAALPEIFRPDSSVLCPLIGYPSRNED
jgi:threonine dehydrogenase-like Zn-dependent dehydrogenase